MLDQSHCFARQEQAMQGDTGDESNFIQLLKLRGKDLISYPDLTLSLEM